MNMKELIKKALAGETLTDEEKAALEAYDPDAQANTRAAEARRAAEKKAQGKDADIQRLQEQLAQLQADLETAHTAGKPQLEQLQAQLTKLQTQLKDKDAAVAKLESEKKGMVRGGKLDKIMQGFRLVGGIDPSVVRLAMERALTEVGDEELDNEASLTPILTKFREGNKGLFADASGGGAGTGAKDGAGSGAKGGAMSAEQVKGMSADDYAKSRSQFWKS